MTRRTQSWYQSKNAKARRDSLLRRSQKGVAAREANRLANQAPFEPKLPRFFPLEICIRNKRTGETSSWHDLRSARAIARQARLLLKYCQ
jgi:hypothetical protein